MSEYSSDSDDSKVLEQSKNVRSKAEMRDKEEEPKKLVRLNKTGKPRKPLTEKQLQNLAEGRKKAHDRGIGKTEKIKQIKENNEIVDIQNNTHYNKPKKGVSPPHDEKTKPKKSVVIKEEKPVRRTRAKPRIIYESSSEEEEEQVIIRRKRKPTQSRPPPPPPKPTIPKLRFI
jgi:hypothetical protein